MKQRITLKFIAEKAGVNQATVSRALNPATSSLISDKVRIAIQKICDEYGYRPSLRGRSIVTGKTFKIAMILGRMLNDFAAHDWARIICSLSSELQKHNYALTLLHADGTESMDKQVKNYRRKGKWCSNEENRSCFDHPKHDNCDWHSETELFLVHFNSTIH